MDASDQCHRIVHDSRACSAEFHFGRGRAVEVGGAREKSMRRDMQVAAWEFATQIEDDDSVAGERADWTREYCRNW